MSYVLWRQGIHPEHRFADSLEAAEALGGIRSDYALRLRARSFTPVDRLHRKGVLFRGNVVPEYVTYCTLAQLGRSQRAKDVALTAPMRKVLGVVKAEGPASRARILQESPLGFAPTNAALKRLYEANYVTRDAAGRFLLVPSPRMESQRARRELFLSLFRAFGIFSAENLSAYTRYEYPMAEVRALLREFEEEGLLAKGFFVSGERTLYWVLRDDLERIGTVHFRNDFVLTPMDNLAVYLRRLTVEKWGMGYAYFVFRGPEIVAAFRAKRRKSHLGVTEYMGDPRALSIVRAFADENEVRVTEESFQIPDSEVMEWYEKMYGRGNAK